MSHTRQLEQLARFAPEVHDHLTRAIGLAPKSAARLTGQALAEFCDTGWPADLARRVERKVQALAEGKIAIRPRGRLTVFLNRRYRIYLYREHDDDLRLWCRRTFGTPVLSKPVGSWAKDLWKQSSVNAGNWKLKDGYKGAIQEFDRKCQEQSCTP